MRNESKPALFYMFCDEQRHESDYDVKFLTSHVAVPQAAWNSLPRDIRSLAMPNKIERLHRIRNLLGDVNGIGLITFAVIPKRYLPPGERDSTNDIQNMSRTDHIWSVTITFGVIATLKWLKLHGLNGAIVDGYHDTKSLNESHRMALNFAVTQQIAKSIKVSSNDDLRVRRFCDVPKAKNNNSADKFQHGVAVADRILRYYPARLGASVEERIHFRDHSEHVVSYLRENFS